MDKLRGLSTLNGKPLPPGVVPRYNLDATRPSGEVAQPSRDGAFSAELVRYALRRWYPLATVCGLLLAVIAAVGIWFLLDPQYRAVAWIRIEDRQQLFALPGQERSPLFLKTQIELIKSPLVLNRAVAQPEVSELEEVAKEPAPAEWLAENLNVKAVGGSELFQIYLDSSEAQTAATIVNGVLDSYLQVQSEMTDAHFQRMMELLEKEKQQRSMDLQRLRANLQDLVKKSPETATARTSKEGGVRNSTLATLQERLISTEVQREFLEAERDALLQSTARGTQVPASAVDREIDNLAAVQEMRNKVTRLEADLHETEQIAARGEDDPVVRRLRQDVANAQEQLRTLRANLSRGLADEMKQKLQNEHASRIESLEAQIAAQQSLEEMLAERIESEKEQLADSGSTFLESEFARSELEHAENVFQRIADRAMAMQAENRAPARITTLERASAPKIPLQKNSIKKAAGVAGICFLLPFFLAIAWESRIARVGNSQQVSRDANLPVIGEIVSLPTQPALIGFAPSQKQQRLRNAFEESIDQLRIRLTLPDHLRDIRVLAVASAVSGEGKTSLASQLAVCLARSSSEPVLLIDGDMRRPDVHQIFNVPLGPGIANVLSGEVALDDAIIRDWSELVHILPAGELTKSPNSLLTSHAFEEVLEALRPRYSYIVIDAPPLLAASEAYVIAKAADGTILCTMRDISRSPQVKLAVDRLKAAGVEPLGVVLNGIPARDYASRYAAYPYQVYSNT